ncbi:MAG: hypothetical protein AAB433_16815 [Nitrospirota bacterium]
MMKNAPCYEVLAQARRKSSLSEWLESERQAAVQRLSPGERLALAIELSDTCWLLRAACSTKPSTR